MLELDDEILIIELQSTKVGRKHHKRFHVYLTITDYVNKTEKQVNLCVFTTAEESKQVIYKVNDSNEFKYDVVSLSDYDTEEIINTINYKIKNHTEITGKELILFTLVPIIEKDGNVEDYVDLIVNTLINLTGLAPSIKELAFGIEWLIVDKFVKDEQKRNILQDVLGDRMSLIHEYGENKARKAEERIVINQLKSGMKAETISKTARIPLAKVKSIERKLKFKN